MAYLSDLEDKDRIPVYSPSGQFGTVTKDELDLYLKDGFRLAAPNEVAKEAENMKYGEMEGQAFGLGAARGATFGGSDWLATKTGLYTPEELRKIEENNPNSSIAGEIAGAVGSMFVPGGQVAGAAKLAGGAAKVGNIAKLAKAAKVGGAAETLALSRGIAGLTGKAIGGTFRGATYLPRGVEQLSKKIASLGFKNIPAQKAAAAALEGVAYSGGHLISREAMEDPNVNAEYRMATLGLGVLGGAAIPLVGAGLGLVKKGAQAFADVYPRIPSTKIGIGAAVENIANEYSTGKGSKKLIKDIDRYLSKQDLGDYQVFGTPAKFVTEVVESGDDKFTVNYRIEKEFLYKGDKQTLVLSNGSRDIYKDGIIKLRQINKDPTFLGGFKGFQNRFYKDIEVPAFQKSGFSGTPITTDAINVATARNFASAMEDVGASYKDVTTTAQREGVQVTDVIKSIEDVSPPDVLKRRESFMPSEAQFRATLSGKVPKPDTVLKKVFKKLGKLTDIDNYVFSRMLDDESLFNQINKNKNLAQSIANEITTEANNFQKAFTRFTNEITGEKKTKIWEDLLPKSTDSIDQFAKASPMARSVLMEAAETIDNMIQAGSGEFGFQNKLKDLLKKLQSAAEATEANGTKLSDLGNLYTKIDTLKRDIGKTIKQANRRQVSMSSDFATLDFLQGPDGRGGLYQTLRSFLENEQLFGKAGRVQKSINEAWTDLLENQNFKGRPRLFVPFGKEEAGGFFDNWEADPDAFAKFFREIAEDKNQLGREYINRWLNNVNKLSEAVTANVLDSKVIGYIHKSGLSPSQFSDDVWEMLLKVDNAIYEKLGGTKIDLKTFKEGVLEIYNKNKELYDAYVDLNSASAVYVPFMAAGEKRAAVNYMDSVFSQVKSLGEKRIQGFRTPGDYFTGLALKEAEKEAKEKAGAIGLGAIGGVAGTVVGGPIPGVAGAAVGAAVGEGIKTLKSPETLIKRYHQIKKVADSLGRFSDGVASAGAKTVSATGKAVPAAGAISAITQAKNVSSLFKDLTNRDPENDEDIITTLNTLDPETMTDRLIDNLTKMTDVDDDVLHSIAEKSIEQLSFIKDKANELSISANPIKGLKARFTPQNKKKLNNYISALNDPLNVLISVNSGKTPKKEELEVLQTFFPNIFQQVIQIVSDSGNNRLKKLFNAQAPVNVSTIQANVYSGQQEAPGGGGGGGVSISAPQPLQANRLSYGK